MSRIEIPLIRELEYEAFLFVTRVELWDEARVGEDGAVKGVHGDEVGGQEDKVGKKHVRGAYGRVGRVEI